jgi:hypothetical protein
MISNVVYTFPFEMRDKRDKLSYYLPFATGHRRGMEKMKEAMRSVGQAGAYEFSDAWTGQLSFFRDDNPAEHAERMAEFFGLNKVIPWNHVDDYALNETPFSNPKAMLRTLEQSNQLIVESNDPKRRRLTYPDHKIVSVTFQ